MFYLNYKGWHIQGYFDKEECRVISPRPHAVRFMAKSYRAAQILITRQLHGGNIS